MMSQDKYKKTVSETKTTIIIMIMQNVCVINLERKVLQWKVIML